MGASFRSWLNRLPFQDPLTRQHALLLQGFLLVILAVMIPALPLALVSGGAGIGLALRFSANIFLLIGLGISFVLLRRGHLQMTVLGIVLSLLITQTLTLIVLGSTVGAALIFITFIPLILTDQLRQRMEGLALNAYGE